MNTPCHWHAPPDTRALHLVRDGAVLGWIAPIGGNWSQWTWTTPHRPWDHGAQDDRDAAARALCRAVGVAMPVLP